MDNTVIKFDMDCCHIELNCPYFLQHMTLAKLKKVFELMCKQSWRNEQAIDTTQQYIELCIAEAKAQWHEASSKYQNGYVDTKFRYGLTKPQKQSIEKENKRLLDTVKRTKTAYERMVKIQDLFNAVKQKFSV